MIFGGRLEKECQDVGRKPVVVDSRWPLARSWDSMKRDKHTRKLIAAPKRVYVAMTRRRPVRLRRDGYG